MRILFHIDSLGGGGAERVCSVVANELASRGHEIYILINIVKDVSYPIDERIIITQIKSKKWGEEYEAEFKQKITEINPDVMVGVMWQSYRRLFRVAWDLGIPIVASDHTNFHWNENKDKKYTRYFLYKFANKVVVLTKNDKRFMRWRLFNTRVIYNPLSFPRLDHPTKRNKNIICMGRVTVWEVKGFDLMIKMWGQIAHKHPDWRLNIIGHGRMTDYEHLFNLIIQENVNDSVDVMGYRGDVQEIMQSSAIFALPSREEGFPCVLTEAMSQGCASVAFRIRGNIDEIITDGVDGYTVDDGDLETFQQRLETLMDNEDLREEMSRKAIESMERFEPEKIGDEWEDMLTKLVKRRKKK